MITVLWFKRDLRIEDNPALARAVASGRPVLPLYIAEPEYWRQPDASGRHWAFIAESLDGLHADLGRLGAPLVVRTGYAVTVLADLHARHGVAEIVSHEETGNGWTFARDRAVAAWAREHGVVWTEIPQPGVVRRLASRDGWAALREREMRKAVTPAPKGIEHVAEDPGAIPSARDLGLAPDPCPDRQKGGRSEALALLDTFLTRRGQHYRSEMSSPLTGATTCSRLSPHLAFGTLGEREAVQAGWRRQREVKGTRDGWIGSLRSFQARMAWRPHFMQKLEDEPSLEFRCLHPAYEGLRPAEPDAVRLHAWTEGETGLPFVDACMRSLKATGWINFRMRAMLVAVASYHFWLDWRATGPVLARYFTDYEPGIHWPQVQMQSGTTGMNTVRIYNPVKQGRDQDPDGVFTRRWCPELADVPDRHLQTPWTWDGAGGLLGKRYPAPIVDPVEAARAAKQKVWAVRSGADHRADAARIVEKHASRKDQGAGRHFVNDRAPKKRRAAKRDPGQMSLDL
ncbi:deoxyribodipyrimidine photolyase [Rhodobacterales bacterium HKCCE3408]|nr:deoxyribodipyrimidine photolyase [Rhodobacterales bacterium HKCCE3408]